MALERNNTALEFETMLRRHLAQGGAVVAACAGFDADAASAYLEGALRGPAQAIYETHLAGCPACRRHFIELSRLAYSLTPPAPVSVPRGLWEQLQTKLADWFEPAEWRWQWAPAMAAAGALVLAVVAAQLWQQPRPSGVGMASAVPSKTVEEQGADATPTPFTLVLDHEAVPTPTADVTVDNKTTARRDVPKPPVEAQPVNEKLTALNLSQAAPQRAADFSNAVPQAPPELLNIPRERRESLPAPSVSLSAGLASPPVSNGTVLNIEAPAPPAAADIETPPVVAARFSPPAEENPARLGKPKLQPVNPRWRERVLGFVPLGKAEAERKTTSAEASTDASRSMAVRINDKLFRFEKGLWTDQAYKSEMQWRVLKLVRGSREYEQLLAAEPQLKEFFARGPILIVWKDKIYKVVGQ